MRILHTVFTVFCLSMALWFTSCKPSIPNEYIQRDKLESILYDYHLAQAMLINEPGKNTPENQRLYKLAVLKKHGVTEAQFEASMEYYMRHADDMYDVYEHLSDRFERSAKEYGITVSELDQYGSDVTKNDTSDVWGGDRSFVLTNHKPFHLRSFALSTDTTYKAGDRLMLNFDTQFIVQEGSREGIVVLAVRFANDSVSSELQRISSNSHYTLQIQDQQRLGIKSVSGYFLLYTPLSDRSTTLKILSFTNIRLIRRHVEEKKKPMPGGNNGNEANGDSAVEQRPSFGSLGTTFSR